MPYFVRWYTHLLNNKVSWIRFIPSPHTCIPLASWKHRLMCVEQVSGTLWDLGFFAAGFSGWNEPLNGIGCGLSGSLPALRVCALSDSRRTMSDLSRHRSQFTCAKPPKCTCSPFYQGSLDRPLHANNTLSSVAGVFTTLRRMPIPNQDGMEHKRLTQLQWRYRHNFPQTNTEKKKQL